MTTTKAATQPAPQQQSQQLVRPQSQVKALETFLMARQKRLAEWAAGRLSPAALIRFALMDYSRDEKLRACTPDSIYLALIACAQTGLEPGSLRQHAWLIPYKGVATFMIGWRGFNHLAHRSRIRLRPELRFEGDFWEEDKGSSPHLIHRPGHQVGAALVGAYAMATGPDSDPDWEYMRLEDLEKVKAFAQRSRGGRPSPYDDWSDQMMRKAPIRRIAKRLPLGEDYLLAGAIDLAAETGDLKTYKTLIDTESELPELEPVEDQVEPAAEPARGAAAVKQQLAQRAKRRSEPTVELDELGQEIAAIAGSIALLPDNPQWLPGLRERIAKLPAGERGELNLALDAAEDKLASARREDDLPGFEGGAA